MTLLLRACISFRVLKMYFQPDVGASHCQCQMLKSANEFLCEVKLRTSFPKREVSLSTAYTYIHTILHKR
jgi:hypothetical protein